MEYTINFWLYFRRAFLIEKNVKKNKIKQSKKPKGIYTKKDPPRTNEGIDGSTTLKM